MIERPDFVTSLSERSKRGEFDICLGREQDIDSLANITTSETAQSVMLLGPPGTGKTELVKGLAQFLVDRHSTAELFEVDLTAFEADTKYMGEQQSKLDSLLRFADATKSGVFFIDEFHSIIGIGSHTGKKTGIEQNFKAALSSGRLRVIAATTDKEFNAFVSGDQALARRFLKHVVQELSAQTTVLIIKQFNQKSRLRNQAYFTDSAISKIVEMSGALYPGVANPARSIKAFREVQLKLGARREHEITFTAEPSVVLASIFAEANRLPKSLEVRKILQRYMSQIEHRPNGEDEVLQALHAIGAKP